MSFKYPNPSRDELFRKAIRQNVPNKFYAGLRAFLSKRFTKVPSSKELRNAAENSRFVSIHDPHLDCTIQMSFPFPAQYLEVPPSVRHNPSFSLDDFNVVIGTKIEFYFLANANAIYSKNQLQELTEILTGKFNDQGANI